MCQFNECFQTETSATAKILKRLNHVTTPTQWNTFLQTQGAGVSCAYRSGSIIAYVYSQLHLAVVDLLSQEEANVLL
jgi:hypothetical protein